MIDRALPRDLEAFAAVLKSDGLGFRAAHGGDIETDAPAHGPAPTLAIRRERQDPPGAVVVLAAIDAGQTEWLALSVTATEYATNGDAMEPLALVVPVMKSSTGEFFVQTHVGRLVGAGEYTDYFWTVAGAHLGLDW